MSDENKTNDGFAGFGVPGNVTGNREYPWRRHSLKTPDENKGETFTRFVGRIIPPYKSLAGDKRGWCFYHDVYFGYDGLSKNNPSKTRMRPFAVKGTDRKNNPAQIKLDARKVELEDLYDSLVGKPESEIKQKTQALNDWVRYHNRDSKWYLNMVGEDNELYVLQITNKCKKDLELEMNKLESQGMTKADIMNPKGGVWFEFIRTGSKLKVGEIQDKVSVVMQTEEFTGPGGKLVKAQTIKPAVLEQPVLEKVFANAPDLALEVVNFLTVEQAQRLVDGPADPSFVDSIWNGTSVAATAVVKSQSDSASDSFFKDFT